MGLSGNKNVGMRITCDRCGMRTHRVVVTDLLRHNKRSGRIRRILLCESCAGSRDAARTEMGE